ncbi:hypothetical protein [Acrocarpospora macrocephala]|uniref:hypothetical protein n=1 Tax=Acrocarpospora macrocephala TaxID=150177 RepID=UPI0012D31ABE|nr:hypothetical protein [Acrocarpospora macrocephala]
MSSRRWIGAVLALLLCGGVAAALVLGNREGSELTVVRGVIGSEKKPFFDDPEVKAAFARHGLRVEVDTAGSREIASSVDLSGYAFAFPSSVPAAEKIKKDRGASVTFSPFHSPMSVATFEPIVDALTRAGVVTGETLDIRKYLDLVAKGTRWDSLPGSSYKARKRVLLTTTDIRTSNSAAMYLAMTSYVANGDDVVTSAEQSGKVAEAVAPLFLDQGYSESTTEAPFEDYLAMGMGKTPMVVIYEAQYAAHLFAADGAIRPEMRLLYPSPTVLSKHTLVPFDEPATRVGRLLTEDPEFAALAARYGFRTANPQVFANLAKNTPLTTNLVNVVEPPTYDHLEQLISLIEERYLKP